MAEKEQVRPLAPATDLISDDEETISHQKKLRRKKLIKCCGCAAALLVALSVTAIILAFTVFKVKDPIITMNGIAITKVELNGVVPKPGSNVSLTADVSVKNPNVASFKYSNTTTSLYIGDRVVGEARGPPGQARARRTARMNITVEIAADEVVANVNLSSATMRMRSFSRIPGRVKLLHVIRRNIVVKMNCTVVINIMNRAIEDHKCKQKVKL